MFKTVIYRFGKIYMTIQADSIEDLIVMIRQIEKTKSTG